jgi:hypothetical protein
MRTTKTLKGKKEPLGVEVKEPAPVSAELNSNDPPPAGTPQAQGNVDEGTAQKQQATCKENTATDKGEVPDIEGNREVKEAKKEEIKIEKEDNLEIVIDDTEGAQGLIDKPVEQAASQASLKQDTSRPSTLDLLKAAVKKPKVCEHPPLDPNLVRIQEARNSESRVRNSSMRTSQFGTEHSSSKGAVLRSL